jgi:ABC-type thiamine transport system substrate-binding protein
LEEIRWDEGFRAFDEDQLAFVYEDETVSGKRSTFNKLVSRETARERAHR